MQQVLRTLNRIGPMRLAVMGAVTLGMVLFFVFITARLNSGDMKLLYADLSPQDSNAMVRELEAAQVPYQMTDSGNSILVSAQEVGRARMLLAAKGLPDGGSVGYEIFDKQSSIGSTRFEQDINQLRALEGELVRTIASLKPVENARVHLVLPRRELFNRDTRPATASVTLKMRVGKTLDDGQVSAIQHLVAAAVPQLEPQRVSIIDQSGTLLASGQVEASADGAIGSNNVEKMRQQYEQRLVMAVDDMVGRIVGMGKVRTQVTADIDYDRESTNAEIFDPEQQVARSTQTVTEKEKTTEAAAGGANGAVSVQNNLPGLPGADAAGGAGSSNDRVEETTNFEIGKTIKNSVREGGRVKQLSVAVLLDGVYNTNSKGEVDYKPRTKEELAQIQTMVAAAIGFDKKRGDKLEVVNMRFAASDLGLEEPLQAKAFLGLNKDDLFRAAEMLVLGLVAILVVLLVLRPLANRLMVATENDNSGGNNGMGGFGNDTSFLGMTEKPALTGPNTMPMGTLANEMPEALAAEDSLIDLASVDGKVRASSVKKVSEIIDKHPNETVAVLRSWMFQEG